MLQSDNRSRLSLHHVTGRCENTIVNSALAHFVFCYSSSEVQHKSL